MAFVPDFLAGVAGKARLNQRDRIHPNAEGYKIIAGNVWMILSSLLAG